MGRSSAALERRTSSGVIELLLLILCAFSIGIKAQYDEIPFNSEEDQASIVNPLAQEVDTPEARRMQPFNLIAPRPSCKFKSIVK